MSCPSGVTQFVAIAAGLKHSLAIGNDGWLYAWGDDSRGELGIGADSNQSLPVKVLKVCAPLSMSASLSCAERFPGTLFDHFKGEKHETLLHRSRIPVLSLCLQSANLS